MTSKTCTMCKLEYPIEDFKILSATYVDGRQKRHSWCLKCLREYNNKRNKVYMSKKYGRPLIEKPKNYLENKALHCEMMVSLAAGKLTRPAAQMIQLIGKGVNRKFYYKTIEDREDALQSGLLDAYKFWMNYEPEKTHNAFAYFTEIIKRGHTKWYNDMIANSHLRLDVLYDDADGWDKI